MLKMRFDFADFGERKLKVLIILAMFRHNQTRKAFFLFFTMFPIQRLEICV